MSGECVECGFEMPSDWPVTKLRSPNGSPVERILCAPCARRCQDPGLRS